MGVVYHANDLELARPVAVKILRATLLDGAEADIRFRREAEILAAIHHPAVVTVHDRGRTQDGEPYLVMELLEGLPLSALLDEAKRSGVPNGQPDAGWIARALRVETLGEASSLRLAVRWIAALADGLAAAHRAGVFHRDVKPSNVFVCRDGRTVLLDFGLAARLSQETITREESTLGSPAYMAPECLGAGHRPSAAVDVYGLTATLYHLLTASAPFSGTPSQILSSLLTEDAPPARSLRPDLPRDLQAILDRGMARRPQDRYATVEELELDLRAFLDHRPVRARPLSTWTRTWRRARRSPLFLPAALVLAVAATFVAGREVRAEFLARRAATYREAWSHVPPNLTLVQPENRVLSDGEGRDEVRALLERAERASADPIPVSVVRAAFLLDHSEPRAAAQAMARVADAHASAYTRALAARYAALPADAKDASAVDLKGLEPVEPADLYMAAFHALRAGRYDEAHEYLDAPRGTELVAAQELQLLLLSGDPLKMYEQATRIEEERGGRSASTAHVLGLALILQKRYEQARAVIDEGLALAPTSHALHLNAGLAAWRLGDLDAARQHFEQSIAFKPRHLLGYENLVRVLMDAEDLDGARAVLAKAPYAEADEGARRSLAGEIEAEDALRLWDADERARAVEAAEEALADFEEAKAVGGRVTTPRLAIAEALAESDTDRVSQGLMDLLAKDPESGKTLGILLKWMPDALDASNTSALERFLRALHTALTARNLARTDPLLSRPR